MGPTIKVGPAQVQVARRTYTFKEGSILFDGAHVAFVDSIIFFIKLLMMVLLLFGRNTIKFD
jgi:hypothetical protein